MVRSQSAPASARRGKGEKRTQKKEAVVTAIYTITPYLRTPQDVVAALLPDAAESQEPRSSAAAQRRRPAPVGKEVRATLFGKDTAFDRLVRRVTQREGPHIQHRVALTDGAEPFQRQVLARSAMFTLVLDILH